MQYTAVIRTLGMGGTYYQRTLDSLIQQSIKPTAIIVYIAEGYSIPKETVGCEKYVYVNKGMVAQRALRYEEVETEYMLFLDDDVYLPSDGVEILYNEMVKCDGQVISPCVFPNHKTPWKAKIRLSLLGREVCRIGGQKWGYRVLWNGGFSYNNNPTKPVYESQTNAGPCFFCRKEDFLRIRYEEELWLDKAYYAFPEDQVMFYKMYCRGLKVMTSFDSGIIHLDASSTVSSSAEKTMKVVYSEYRNKLIFWYRFLFSPERNPFIKAGMATVFSYTYGVQAAKYLLFYLAGKREMARAFRKGVHDGISYCNSNEYKQLPKNQKKRMKKKILFLMPALPGGGAEKVLIDILKNFDYAHYDVSLFLEYREGVYLPDIPRNVKVLHLHKSNNLWFQRLHRRLVERRLYGKFHELVYRPMFLRLLRGKKYDTIISFMEGSALKFHSYITGKAQKNLSWVHIDLKKKHWSLDFFRNEKDEAECYQKMDNVIFVSNDARQRFLKIYPMVDADRCRVVYNLIDGDEIKRQATLVQVEKRKFTICMVGRFNRQKRYDRAIEVTRHLKASGHEVDFWILGEGELKEELNEKIKEYGLEDSVFLKGFIKQPYAYISHSDLFLNTSESEGYPLTICEALCLGCPVVATNITGTSEILDKSQYGLLVDENKDAIYNGVRLLIDNEGLRKDYARKALERAKTFQVEETMDNIYTIL